MDVDGVQVMDVDDVLVEARDEQAVAAVAEAEAIVRELSDAEARAGLDAAP
jgi:hypothetical protein